MSHKNNRTKRSRQGRDKGNPNRPRSKNNPKGKRKDPPVDWPKYNKRRSKEGVNCKAWFRRLAGEARRLLGVPPGMRDVRVSAILCAIIKSESNYSYWGLYNHFRKHPDDVELCELKKQYCRSWHHLRISGAGPEILQRLITWSAGDDIKGTQLVDSSGYATYAYEDWYNAKYGLLDARSFVKLHIMVAPHGRITAATVTGGHDGDSPEFAKLNEFLKPGEGYAVGDSAYISRDNCRAAAEKGRKPIMQPKSNSTIHGFTEMAEMLKMAIEHPGTFYKMVRLRNNVESVFSSLKERFGGMVRAAGARTRAVELLSKVIAYNMVAGGFSGAATPAGRVDCARPSENRQDPAAGLCRHAKSEEFGNAGDRRAAGASCQNRSFLDKARQTEHLIALRSSHSHMARERIVPKDDRLHDLGYNERNKQKLGLYSKRLQHCTAYLDHRDIGGKSAEEQIDQGPMFYSFAIDGHAAWEHNREAMLEQRRLAENGVKYRISIISRQPLVGEPEYLDGYCKTCGRDFQADGAFCSDACARVFATNQEARKEGIPVMGLMDNLGIEYG